MAAPEVLGFGDDLSTPTNPFTYHGLNFTAAARLKFPQSLGPIYFQKTTDLAYTSSVADGNNNTVPTAIIGVVNDYPPAPEEVVIKDSVVGGSFIAVSAYLHARDVESSVELSIGISGSNNGSINPNCQQTLPGMNFFGGPTLVSFGGHQASSKCVVDTLSLLTSNDFWEPMLLCSLESTIL